MDLDFFNRIEKERQYKDYLVYHINGVEKSFNDLILPLRGVYGVEFDAAIDRCANLVPLHDLSKMSVFEFDPYRAHHYPTDLEKSDKNLQKEIETAYNEAKLHHYLVNPHHPYYWVKNGVNSHMPLEYILEMLCDWSSVSRHYDSRVIDFYDKKAKKERAAFTEKTAETVDMLVNKLFREPGNKY